VDRFAHPARGPRPPVKRPSPLSGLRRSWPSNFEGRLKRRDERDVNARGPARGRELGKALFDRALSRRSALVYPAAFAER